jgi:hypothetical protein
MFLIFIIIFSLILNGVLAYTTWNLFRKNEIAEDFIILSYMSADRALSDMRDLDISGAFEADDETGVTFKALHQVIKDHAKFVGVEDDTDSGE